MTSCRRWVYSALALMMLVAVACGTRVPADRIGKLGQGAGGYGIDDFPRSDGRGPDVGAGTNSALRPGAGKRSTPAAANDVGSALEGSPQGSDLALGDRRAPLRVGVIYHEQDSGNAAMAAAGTNATFNDAKGEISFLLKHVNDRGGFGGRKVTPVWYGIDSMREMNQGESVPAQAKCDYFTRDHKVPLVIISGHVRGTLLVSCLAKRGVVMIHVFSSFFDDGVFNALAPYLYSPSILSGSRLDQWIDGLASIGYFSSGAKLGAVTFDTAMHHRIMARTVQPASKRHGQSPEVAYISGSDLSEISAQTQSAVLRFKSNGVNRVIFVGTWGALPFFFVPAAVNQQYYPRYGWNTHESPRYQGDQQPDGMRNSVGFGWNPFRDVHAAQRPGPNSGVRKCVSLLKHGGFYKSKTRVTEGYSMAGCDAVFFLRAVLNRTEGDLSPRVFRDAVTALRGTYVSPSALRTQLGPGRYDGVSQMQPLRWNPRCECFEYFGSPLKVR